MEKLFQAKKKLNLMNQFTGSKKILTAVFISGRGSNLNSLIKFSKKKSSPIKINLVISNTKKAEEETIRKKYGISIDKNSIHGSDSLDNAKIEIEFFFKN